MSGTPVLTVRDLVVRYGPIPALRGVSLDVGEGEIVAVIGPNGAGKTTLVRAIAGLERAAAGSVALGGRDITALATHRRVQAGIAMVPQGRRVFPESSVRMNLWAGAFTRRDGAVDEDMERVLQLFGALRERLDQPAGVLSGGEQQMLAVGRAMMSRPRLLLLDEPSMGLAPLVVGRIFEALSELARVGTTMLLVEQNVARALQIAGRMYVLRVGEVVGEPFEARGVTADELAERYLGVGVGVPGREPPGGATSGGVE
jgi:branched-chain amino acid transport system ATP-binding protein